MYSCTRERMPRFSLCKQGFPLQLPASRLWSSIQGAGRGGARRIPAEAGITRRSAAGPALFLIGVGKWLRLRLVELRVGDSAGPAPALPDKDVHL